MSQDYMTDSFYLEKGAFRNGSIKFKKKLRGQAQNLISMIELNDGVRMDILSLLVQIHSSNEHATSEK